MQRGRLLTQKSTPFIKRLSAGNNERFFFARGATAGTSGVAAPEARRASAKLRPFAVFRRFAYKDVRERTSTRGFTNQLLQDVRNHLTFEVFIL
jgi:hypothetical protein